MRKPFCIRLSEEEKKILKADAKNLKTNVSTLIRMRSITGVKINAN